MARSERIVIGEGEEAIELERKRVRPGVEVYIPTPEETRKLNKLYREMVPVPEPSKPSSKHK